MEQKQQPHEPSDKYYTVIHDLTLRMKRKMPDQELIKIIKSNVKSSLVTLIFAVKGNSIVDLKAECKRAEKLLRENRQKSRQVNEINYDD